MIPRSMPKRAIIMEIECASFGKINGFSRLLMALIMPFDLLSVYDRVANYKCRANNNYKPLDRQPVRL